MYQAKVASKKAIHTQFKKVGEPNEGYSKYMHYDGFNYVVNPPLMPKVAFGSSLERVCLPLDGPQLSSFMRRIQGENRVFPGPFEHQYSKRLGKKLPSKHGHTAFANKGPRLPPTEKPWVPPLGTYDVEPPRDFTQTYRPFGSAVPRDMYDLDNNPGPASYPIHEPLPYQKRILAFQTSGFRWPAVYMFCTPSNRAICIKCKKVPYGDFFHNFTKKLDMCRRCMKNEIKQVKDCAVDGFLRQKVYRELKEFKRARYCGFFHNHAGTNAAVQLMSTEDLHKKLTVENYLYQFIR